MAGQRWDQASMARLVDCVFRVPLMPAPTASAQCADTLIVGAFGNGAFANDAAATAALFASTTTRYRRFYRHIIYAVPECPDSSDNAQVYRRVLVDAGLLVSSPAVGHHTLV